MFFPVYAHSFKALWVIVTLVQQPTLVNQPIADHCKLMVYLAGAAKSGRTESLTFPARFE
jgi:hypothetical protein